VLQGAAIRKITRSDDGSLWIASSKGIFRYADGTLESVVTNYDVRDVIADGTGVWAATINGGLLHIGRDDLFAWIVSDLNVEQGMPSQQVFALLKRENDLLIGTNRGVVTYSASPVQPKVVVNRVLSRRLYRPEEWNNLISLDYPENSLLVEVAGQSSRTFPSSFNTHSSLRTPKAKGSPSGSAMILSIRRQTSGQASTRSRPARLTRTCFSPSQPRSIFRYRGHHFRGPRPHSAFCSQSL